MTGLSRMQVLQSAGSLKKAGIVQQDRKNDDTAYVQIESFQHLKSQIASLVRSPQKIKEVATKRNPSMPTQGVTFVKSAPKTARGSGSTRVSKGKPLLKIAFLTTNPDPDSSLRTDIEVRDVREAVAATNHWDKIDIEHLPAATLDTLIDALNEYAPDILHFSGHAGGGTILLDNKSPRANGGVVLDFGRVAALLQTAKPPPKVLVLSACDTVRDAERFLDTVQAVIAMAASIDDAAACHFSRRFYKSIASGATLADALVHAKVVLQADDYDDYDLPTLIARDDHAREISFF
jgi:CHAT domain-containing protein